MSLSAFLSGARPNPDEEAAPYRVPPLIPMAYERWTGDACIEVPTLGFVYRGPRSGRCYEVLQQYDVRVGRFWTWREAGDGEHGAPTSTLDDLHPTPEACLAHLDAADAQGPHGPGNDAIGSPG